MVYSASSCNLIASLKKSHQALEIGEKKHKYPWREESNESMNGLMNEANDAEAPTFHSYDLFMLKYLYLHYW